MKCTSNCTEVEVGRPLVALDASGVNVDIFGIGVDALIIIQQVYLRLVEFIHYNWRYLTIRKLVQQQNVNRTIT